LAYPSSVIDRCFLLGLALRGLDILGAAKTGSGKTLAFIIPIFGKHMKLHDAGRLLCPVRYRYLKKIEDI
jgi:superfamily II DNA/RNA helicase